MNYFITYTIYVLIASVLFGLSTWKLFQKMGYNPLFAFVPFYNYYIVLKETDHPKWWCALSYLPIVGPIMMSVFHIFLMKKFGKNSTMNAVLTVILPFLYMAYVNYAEKPEIYKEEELFLLPGEEKPKKKESFIGSVTFAVVFATIIHTFITQPFGIPTGSMERTLLVGDFLFVNKLNYGYRFPMRPVAIPFLQGTIFDSGQKGNPKDDPKSYVEAVKLPYFRLPGWEKPQKNDIVVFNYPQDSVHTAIDRRDPYVKRCVGVAGDVIEFRDGRLFVNNKPEQILGDQYEQHAYFVQSTADLDLAHQFEKTGFISNVAIDTGSEFFKQNSAKYKWDSKNYLYLMQLSDELVKYFKNTPGVVSVDEQILPKGESGIAYKYDSYGQKTNKIDTVNSIFPINKNFNQDQYGPIRIPKKGDVVALNQESLPTYRWIISEYEHNHLENKNGQIFINGKPANSYTIQQDYYMMIGDNRDASLDARFFGFVPFENIIGKPMFTWLSIQGAFADAGSTVQAPFKIRWDRMFKGANTGEANKTSYWWVAVILLIVFFGWDYIMKIFKKNK